MSFHQWNSSAASAIPLASEQQHQHLLRLYQSESVMVGHSCMSTILPPHATVLASTSPNLTHPIALTNMHHFVQPPYPPAAAASFTSSNTFTGITPMAVNNTAPTITRKKCNDAAVTGPKSCAKKYKNDDTTSNI